MNAWVRQHARAFTAAVSKVRAQPMTSALGALVIGIALALPAGGYALLSNLSGLARRSSLEPQLSLFMSPQAKAGSPSLPSSSPRRKGREISPRSRRRPWR